MWDSSVWAAFTSERGSRTFVHKKFINLPVTERLSEPSNMQNDIPRADCFNRESGTFAFESVKQMGGDMVESPVEFADRLSPIAMRALSSCAGTAAPNYGLGRRRRCAS